MDNLHKIIHETLLIMEIIIKVAMQSSFSDLIMFCPFYFVFFFFLNSLLSVLFLFIYLFLAPLGLHCSVWAFSGCSKRRLLCCDAPASRYGGFSCCGAQASVGMAHGL